MDEVSPYMLDAQKFLTDLQQEVTAVVAADLAAAEEVAVASVTEEVVEADEVDLATEVVVEADEADLATEVVVAAVEHLEDEERLVADEVVLPA